MTLSCFCFQFSLQSHKVDGGGGATTFLMRQQVLGSWESRWPYRFTEVNINQDAGAWFGCCRDFSKAVNVILGDVVPFHTENRGLLLLRRHGVT